MPVSKPRFVRYRSSHMSNVIPAPLQGRPETKAQLDAMKRVRTEVIDQIDELSDRRGEMVQERLNAQAANNNTVAGQLDAQIREHSDRLARLERQKLQMDDAIMNAVRRGVGAEPGVPGVPAPDVPPVPAPPPPPGFPEAFTTAPPPEPNWLQTNGERLIALNLFVLLFMGLFAWRAIRRAGRRADPAHNVQVEKLSQAVDAIAVEVERISENQRYVTKLMNERMLGEGAAQPVQASAKDRVDAR